MSHHQFSRQRRSFYRRSALPYSLPRILYASILLESHAVILEPSSRTQEQSYQNLPGITDANEKKWMRYSGPLRFRWLGVFILCIIIISFLTRTLYGGKVFVDLLAPLTGSFAVHVFLKWGLYDNTPTPTIVRMDMIRREDDRAYGGLFTAGYQRHVDAT